VWRETRSQIPLVIDERLGLSHSTLSRQMKQGKIRRRPDGLVSLAEVRADRKANLHYRPERAGPAAGTLIEDEGGLLDPRFVHAAWRNNGTTSGRDEIWREFFSMFAALRAPFIAEEFGIDERALHKSLLLHVYSHIAAILPGYAAPLAADGEAE
jgi:hypothetical protein